MNEIQLDFGLYERSYRLNNHPHARIWRYEELSEADRAKLDEQMCRYLREKPSLAEALRRR